MSALLVGYARQVTAKPGGLVVPGSETRQRGGTEGFAPGDRDGRSGHAFVELGHLPLSASPSAVNSTRGTPGLRVGQDVYSLRRAVAAVTGPFFGMLVALASGALTGWGKRDMKNNAAGWPRCGPRLLRRPG